MAKEREARIAIPSLFGGISRQPPSIRHINQCEDAQNAYFSVLDGCSKRPGTRFIKDASGSLTTSENYRLHAIDRDGTEKYLVVYGDGEIEVWELLSTGSALAATVNIDSAAQTYLDLNTPTADQLRLISIADYTLIVNTTVALGTSASSNFSVTANVPDLETLYNTTPDSANLYYSVGEGDDLTYYQYTPADSITYAYWDGPIATGAWGPPPYAYDDNEDNLPNAFNVGFQRLNLDITGGTFTNASKTLVKTGAFASYTLKTGDQIYVTGGTGVTTGWYGIASRDSDNQITLDSDIGGTNPTDVSTDAIGVYVEVVFEGYDNPANPTMYDVAKHYSRAVEAVTGGLGSVNWIESGSGGYFRITSPYRGSGTKIFDPASPTTSTIGGVSVKDPTDASGEPFHNSGSGNTDGTGSPSPNSDGLAQSARWTKVAAPNQAGAKLDSTKMPVQMVRTSYTGNGSTPAVFDIDPITWTDRTTGDNDTNPAPSLWTDGDKIADASFHRNRLVFAGDEHVVFSQAGDFFNFFIEDDENIVDSDPIDASLSSEAVTLIDYVVPFRNTLVIFTKAGRQFELNAPDALTPTTAAITASTRYDALQVRPSPMGHLLYFAAQRKTAGQVYEYYYDDSRVSSQAADITAHVEGLLPTDIRTLVTSPNNSMVFVLPTDCDTIYAYIQHWSGNKKEQSAWSRWIFDSGYRIADIAVIRNDLHLLVETDSQLILESVPVARQVL